MAERKVKQACVPTLEVIIARPVAEELAGLVADAVVKRLRPMFERRISKKGDKRDGK